ncbi:cell division protein FtsW [Schaalia meyeri]|uniref:Probable peptidoglycan glycosyltransferase FtsW n=1 Tax=Schaalia meyeri TaxID=52773 RepID=A0AAP9Y902_9ACTO|nr:putative peptidoglycan glycosyltransferase FtsW [Schaalia meyeri]AKU64717.1 cell division protein FtsW [Schaalia meyeri]OFQ24428.1 cell division protein FtsW [Actinomyces sp. HMSC062G12]QQC44617.1 cell division protein FtsW [Schaalia meyeri]
MAMNKRGWHIPTVTLPRIRFGSGQEREDSPVTTYYLVVIPALLLSVFGLVMGFSAQTVTSIAQGENPYTAYARPLLIIVFSLVIATLVQLIPQRLLLRLSVPMFVAALVFQGLVLTPLGRSEGGNANWVKLGPIMAQPSELLKLSLVVFLAFMVSKSASKRSDIKTMGVAVGLPLLVALGAVMLGRDMGTAMVVATGALGAVWVAGLPKRWFGGLAMFAIPTLVLLVLSNPTRIRRILAVLPGTSKSPDESAPEQIDHSLWALGSGGLTGLGPGASREKWNYLQAAHTDFIFAIVGEEFGLLGTLAVLVCLSLLVWGMFRVARESSDLFVVIASSGVATWIGVQTAINVLSVTGIGPVIGVPLPLVSYGGSSFLFTITAVAVVASFARARAGMWMIGRPDEASAGRDPRVAPRRRAAR